MDAVHWWALAGLVSFGVSGWLLKLAIDRDNSAAEHQATATHQVILFREAAALSRCGARDEAIELLEQVIKIGEKN